MAKGLAETGILAYPTIALAGTYGATHIAMHSAAYRPEMRSPVPGN
jgi:hypothetical protein